MPATLQLDLAGAWTLTRLSAPEMRHPAVVPGCVHLDLLAARAIPDPLYGDNERSLMWIGNTDWAYERSFELPAEWLAQDRVELVCEGLDTLAEVVLNGRTVLHAENMYRTWVVDVGAALRAGTNTLRVLFPSPTKLLAQRQEQRPLHDGFRGHRLPGNNQIRKEPCNFGWDWGPMCQTAGIWRPIRLRAWNRARFADVAVRQDHAGRGVQLDLTAELETVGRLKGLLAECVVQFGGQVVARAEAPVAGRRHAVRLRVPRPQLWWPNGLGEQPLYEVRWILRDADGVVLDETERRIGLRTLELVQQRDEWGHSFHFRCNGVDFFAKGANWIPDDVFQARVTPEDYAERLGAAAAANMNMLRVWGGGVYEDDRFYDRCDELGLCVWQDFMFACSAYPAHNPEFMESVRKEAEDNVRRLRSHACLALWCGNNELEQMGMAADGEPRRMTREEYRALFDRLLPGVLRRLDPGRPYIPSSEHTPARLGDRWNSPGSDACGDAHLWEVWHGRKPFEWYRTAHHRFCSEFGFQSFPEPSTVRTYAPAEEHNITSYTMELHQRSGNGNALILHYMLSWFRLPNGFENTLWLSQIQQGLAIKYAVEHWRRNRPRCMGALYWQLNDCWPVASWASIDSEGRWKALHYMARAFYAPLLVSGVEDPSTGRVAVFVCSDERTARPAVLRWRITRADGSSLAQGRQPLRIAANASAAVRTLDLSAYLQQFTARDLLVWLALEEPDGTVLSRNLVSFGRPKHMPLADPQYVVDVEPSRPEAGQPSEFRVTVTTAATALWTWLEIEGRTAAFSDNFVCIEPESPTVWTVRTDEPMPEARFRKALRVRSLWDTCR